MQPKSVRVLRDIALVAAISAGGFALAGCGECTVQHRFMEFRVSQAMGGTTTEAFLLLSQSRGSEEGRFVMWFVRVHPLTGTPGQVQLRAASGASAGQVLYRFPFVNAVTEQGVITQVFGETPYGGLIPFAELWDLVQRDQVLVEVIDSASNEVLQIGPLELTNSRDWQDALCS